MIDIINIKKEYYGRCVLNIESLHFEQGRRYALLGANGSGKSTLIKIIAGTEKQTQGQVRMEFGGKKEVGYLPQTPYGFSFSVLKNVLMALDAGPDRVIKAKAAIEAVGMTALMEADASKLSGGETQRTAFARIISMPRKLLLLDEPTAATDLSGIDMLEAALLKYYETNGCTVIFASHSPAQAKRLADEVIFLHQGEVAEHGETSQVLNDPKSGEVRNFLKHWKV